MVGAELLVLESFVVVDQAGLVSASEVRIYRNMLGRGSSFQRNGDSGLVIALVATWFEGYSAQSDAERGLVLGHTCTRLRTGRAWAQSSGQCIRPR